MNRRIALVGLITLAAVAVLLFVRLEPATLRGEPERTETIAPEERDIAPDPAQEPDRASSGSEMAAAPLLFEPVDDMTAARLDEWAQGIVSRAASATTASSFDYVIVKFNDVLLENLRSGAVSGFQFTFDPQNSYRVTIDQIVIEPPGLLDEPTVVLRGAPDGAPPASRIRLFMRSNNYIAGDLFVMGVGRFVIKSNPQIPYHLVYKRVGTRYTHGPPGEETNEN